MTSTNGTPATQQEAMQRLRAELDPLIALVGKVTEVTGDGPLACDPGNDAAGFASTYQVRLEANPDALETLTSQIVPDMKAKGWRVERSDRQREVDFSFHGHDLDFGVTLSSVGTDRRATASGSGPCLPQKG